MFSAGSTTLQAPLLRPSTAPPAPHRSPCPSRATVRPAGRGLLHKEAKPTQHGQRLVSRVPNSILS
ncbi:hypothetical protein GQ55_6G198000 [Panicum hallii var. hallii]|uniref:Uncharacterized protein n=1 Tax=Panicum hallii var. hallii TaxID=1504633 RepID=A0A2T7D7L5_9POAL|nr:hypothetical protein GQ55_6G198000 [Panicum hallii var. hallii]